MQPNRSAHSENKTEKDLSREMKKGMDIAMSFEDPGWPPAVLDMVPGMIWLADQNGFYIYFNRNWLQFRQRTVEEEKGLGWIEGLHPEDVQRALDTHADAANRQLPFTRYFRMQGSDGYRWFKDHGSPIIRNGEFRGFCGTATDITAEMTEREFLLHAIEDAETLFRESNHRMKNHLQLLYTMISLQAQQAKDPPLKAILQDCQNRVHVIALLQEKLFSRDLKEDFQFADYVRDLIQMIFDSYSVGNKQISIDTEVDSVIVHPSKVIPCGLIITELLTNVFKHAFPGKQRGAVTLRFRTEGEYHILEIVDKGVGIAGTVNIAQTPTLGLKLVSVLSRQLGGQVRMVTDGGTNIQIRFPR